MPTERPIEVKAFMCLRHAASMDQDPGYPLIALHVTLRSIMGLLIYTMHICIIVSVETDRNYLGSLQS